MGQTPQSGDSPGTVFPELNGDDPGSQEGSVDITGLVLNDLVEKKDDVSIAQGQGLGVGEPVIEGQDEPAPEKAAVDDLGIQPGGRKRRTVQDRIDQLTRRYRASEETNGALTAQLQELTGLVAAQQRQLAALTGQRAPAAAPATPASGDNFGDLLGGGAGPAAAPGTGQPPPLDVSGIVSKAIEDYDRKLRNQASQVEQVRAAHEASFEEACEELPALRDQRTSARKLFNDLFNKSPLKQLPDAPYQIALQVKGILADEVIRRPNTAAQAERKRQASVIVPNPTPTDTPEINRGALQADLAKTMAAIRGGDNTTATYKRARILREMIRRNGK